MNQILKVTVIAMQLVLAVSCAKSGGNASGDNTTETILVQPSEETSGQQYSDLFYKVSTEKCEKKEIHFYFLSTFVYGVNLPKTEDGRRQKASIALYLIPDGNYVAFYSEQVNDPKSWNGLIWNGTGTGTKRFDGQWTVNGDGALILSDFGKGSLIKTKKSVPRLRLVLEKDIISPDVAGKGIELVYVQSTGSEIDRDRACPAQ